MLTPLLGHPLAISGAVKMLDFEGKT